MAYLGHIFPRLSTPFAHSDGVVIRTTSGELNINAPVDTVKHYGNVDLLDIENVGTSSYHEFGYVPYAQIQQGRIINEVYTEDKSGVQNLFLVAATANSFNEIVVGSAPNAKLPKLDRTDVTIGDGVKVCEVQTGVTETGTATKDYVWLFGDGTVESQKVVVTSSTSKPADTGTIDAATSQGKAANELANIANKPKASSADIEIGKTEFTGGAGIETNPYFISTVEQFNKIADSEYIGKSFFLTSDITIDVKDFTYSKSYIANFNGSLSGNGHRIIVTNVESTTTTDFSIFSNMQGMLKDLVIVNNAEVLVSITSGKDRTNTNEELTSIIFNNVDYGYKGINKVINLSSDNCGFYTQNGVDNVSFIDCDAYYNVNSTAKYVGIFVGGRVNQHHASDTTLYFENCSYYGSAFAGAGFGILIGNTNNNRTSENVTIVNCANYGNVLGFGVVGLVSTGSEIDTKIDSLKEHYSSELKNYGFINQLADDGTDVTIQGYPNGQYVIKKGSTDVDYYEFRFHESLKFYDSNTGNATNGPWIEDLSFKIRIRIDSSSLSFEDSCAGSGLHVSSYTSYEYWKEHHNGGNSYTGEWAQSEEGVPYFYDSTHKCFAFDLDSYAEQFRIAHGMGSNYKVSGTATGIANMTMFAYKDGEIVAYVNLGAAWGSN